MLVHPFPATGHLPPPRSVAAIPPITATPLVSPVWFLGSGEWTNCQELTQQIRATTGLKHHPKALLVLQLQPLRYQANGYRQHPTIQVVHVFTTSKFAAVVKRLLCKSWHETVSGTRPGWYNAVFNHPNNSHLLQWYIDFHQSITAGNISLIRTLPPGTSQQRIRRTLTYTLRSKFPNLYFFLDSHRHIPNAFLITYQQAHRGIQQFVDKVLPSIIKRNGSWHTSAITVTPPSPALNPPTPPPTDPPLATPSTVTPMIPDTTPMTQPSCHPSIWNPSTFPSAVDWTYLLATPTNIFQWKPTKPLTKSPPTHLNHRRWLMSLLKQHQATAWDINFYPRLWRLAGHGSTC